MAHDVVDASHHLILGDGEREARVQNREVGVAEVIEQLTVFRVTGDNRTTVHLRACASHCQHTAHGNPTAGHRLPVLEVVLPRITIVPGTSCYGLAVVNSRSATHTKDEIHILLASYTGTLQYFFNSRIGHHTSNLYNLTACLLQLSHYQVVDAVALNASATIAEHHLLAIVFQFFTQFAQRILTEVQLRGIVECKIA